MATWTDTADFEGAASDFDSVVDTGGELAFNTASKKNSVYGMEVTYDYNNVAYGVFLSNFSSETTTTAECWIDPNGLTMADGDSFQFMVSNGEWYCRLHYIAGEYKIDLTVNKDSGTTTTSKYTVGDEYHQVRVVWGAATAAAADDGFCALYIDGEFKEFLDSVDNDTKSSANMWWGACDGLDATTSGSFYMDDCRWLPGAILICPDAEVKVRTAPGEVQMVSPVKLTTRVTDTRLRG